LSNAKREFPRSYYFSFERFFKDKAQGISNILADLSLYKE
jgi:hypothetical protein